MREAAAACDGGGGAEARSSPGRRLSSIARLLDYHARQRSAQRDRLGRALPLSVSARTLAGIGDERWMEPRGSTARCGRRLLSCWAVAPKELANCEAAAACDSGGGAEARSSLGPRLSSIARLLGHHVRQQPAHRDRLGRAQPLSMFARTLAPPSAARGMGTAREWLRCRRRSISGGVAYDDSWRRA